MFCRYISENSVVMAYLSITRLGLQIQEKLNKLNAGNLTLNELDDLKKEIAELHERIIILNYKAEEKMILKSAGEILEAKREPEKVVQEQNFIKPIKIQSEPVQPKVAVEPVIEKKPEPVIDLKVDPIVEKTKPVISAEPVQQHLFQETHTAPEVLLKAEEKNAVGKQSLVERLQKTRIQDLKAAIGLNQKFLFMNSLFEGENTSYNDAIEKLNAMPTAADARHYIRELAYIYNWNYEDENVILFTEYIERRYL